MADRSLANPRSRSAIDHDHAVRLPSSPLPPASRSPNSTISDPSTPSPNPKRIRTLGPNTPSSALAAFSVSSPASLLCLRSNNKAALLPAYLPAVLRPSSACPFGTVRGHTCTPAGWDDFNNPRADPHQNNQLSVSVGSAVASR
ncbi:hypothetical protein B0H65DRAFT_443550 [Neurospora tetraspora]|uniref:Uncharacterized protein n=1 Tax=Neurospora tetraspora TaxID=94610 RepID=A0AAE0MR72_9PEZI|nr:hypothetical protein B0H65DRAFT_443550 [Neurospora tetraspora]